MLTREHYFEEALDVIANDGVEAVTIATLCQRLGVTYYRLPTDRPLELMLFDFLRQRMQRRRALGRSSRNIKAA